MLTEPTQTFLDTELEGFFGPVRAHAKIGLAVSGGADSLGLMVLAHQWQMHQASPPQFIVYIVDHGLRVAAAAEAKTVAAQAAEFGFAARILRWDGDKPGTGIQAAARAARYRLIGAAMGADGVRVVLTGHQAEDQAETILMRLAHGSGTKGLAGMAAHSVVEGTSVYRPLLGVGRDTLANVVAAAGLVAVDDPSNADPRYERVRWRAMLGPLDELGLDAKRLGQFARRMNAAEKVLAREAEVATARLLRVDNFGVVWLDRDGLLGLPPDTGFRVLRSSLAIAVGREIDRQIGLYEALLAALGKGREFTARTLRGAIIDVTVAKICIFREAARIGEKPVRLGPSETVIWDRRFEITAGHSAAIQVVGAEKLTRVEAEKLVGTRLVLPMAAVRAAPLILSASGTVLRIGAGLLPDGGEVVVESP